MKTTVHIADALIEEAQRIAARDGTTLKELVNEGLRKVLAERSVEKPLELKDFSFGGDGYTEEFRTASWQEILDASYEGRGG